MSENKKGPGSSLANSQGTNKSSNKLYHERNEESKMRLTMRNHKSYTYRASLIRVDNNCAIGDIVDKLGKYEDICDDPERLKEMVKEKSIPEQ